MTDEVMRMLTVYDHPTDHPNHYVLRWWLVKRGNPQPIPLAKAELFKDLATAHAYIAQEWPHLSRAPLSDPDPHILETWW